MSTSAEFLAAVRRATADTPYAVKETTRGFDLTIDVADARWLAILKAHGLNKVFTHQVTLDEPKKQMVIVDVSNTLSWGAGGGSPRLSAERTVRSGRVHEKSIRKEYGVDLDSGKVGKVVDYSFDASQGRDLIRAVADEQGWSERMGGGQKIGLIAGIGALVLCVGIFGAWGITTLLG